MRATTKSPWRPNSTCLHIHEQFIRRLGALRTCISPAADDCQASGRVIELRAGSDARPMFAARA